MIDRLSHRALLVRIFDDGSEAVGTATGFVINTNVGCCLATARHVVTGRHHFNGQLNKKAHRPRRIEILHRVKHANENMIESFCKWTSEELYLDEDCQLPRWYEYPKYGRIMDFCLIPLTPDVNLHYAIVDTTPGKAEFSTNEAERNFDTVLLEPALPVSVIGYPFGHFENSGWPLWSTGFIASEPDFTGQNNPLIIDCRSREGQSGSPVYVKHFRSYRDGSGKDVFADGNIYSFVGLYSGRLNNESDLGIIYTATQLHYACQNLIHKEYAPLPNDSSINPALTKIGVQS